MRRTVPSAAQVRRWSVAPALSDHAQPEATDRSDRVDGREAVLHGVSLNDLQRIARTVVVANAQWWSGGDRHDQVETAWLGIVECLCSADQPPTERDLHAAGTRALVEETKAWRRHHGIADTGDVGPRFAAFWYDPPRDPWEDRVVDRIALGQILAAIPAHQRDAFDALAKAGDYALAAQLLGIKYPALVARLRHARTEFLRSWYWPESAPRRRGTDRRVGAYGKSLATHCGNGHEWTPENTRWDKGRTAASARVRRCRACESDRSRARVAARAVRAGAAA